MGETKITTDTEVSTTELACVLGITGRRVRQLTEDGVLEKDDGAFNLSENVQRYIQTMTRDKTSEKEKAKADAELSMKKAKAIKAVLEANELQGKMHRSEDVAAMTEDLVYTIRSRLIAMPGRLAVDVSNTSNAAEAAEVIRKEVYAAMDELSRYQYDPKKYAERVRERQSWDSTNGIDDDGDE